MWDPIFVDILWEVNTPCSGTVIAANPAGVLQEYLHDAAGPYSSAGGYFSYEKIPSDLRKNFTARTVNALKWFPDDWPEVNELGFGFPDGTGGTIGVMSTALMTPLSRGNVSITSSSSKSGGRAVHTIPLHTFVIVFLPAHVISRDSFLCCIPIIPE